MDDSIVFTMDVACSACGENAPDVPVGQQVQSIVGQDENPDCVDKSGDALTPIEHVDLTIDTDTFHQYPILSTYGKAKILGHGTLKNTQSTSHGKKVPKDYIVLQVDSIVVKMRKQYFFSLTKMMTPLTSTSKMHYIV